MPKAITESNKTSDATLKLNTPITPGQIVEPSLSDQERESTATEKLIDESEFALLFVDLESHVASSQDLHPNKHTKACKPFRKMHSDSNSVLQSNSNPYELNKHPKKRGRPKKDKFLLQKKSHKKSSKGKKRIDDSPEHILPDRLKKKPKVESDQVIDLTRREIKPSLEKSFDLNETIEFKTYKQLKKEPLLCSLCGKPANYATLDALFGPYKLKVYKDSNNLSSLSISDKLQTDEAEGWSVWLHRDCAVWTPNVCLLGCNLVGLGPALIDAAKTKCSLCSCVGATLACLHRSCEDRYHYVCAKQIGCSFIRETFSILCQRHK